MTHHFRDPKDQDWPKRYLHIHWSDQSMLPDGTEVRGKTGASYKTLNTPKKHTLMQFLKNSGSKILDPPLLIFWGVQKY